MYLYYTPIPGVCQRPRKMFCCRHGRCRSGNVTNTTCVDEWYHLSTCHPDRNEMEWRDLLKWQVLPYAGYHCYLGRFLHSAGATVGMTCRRGVVPFIPTGCIQDVAGGRLPPLHAQHLCAHCFRNISRRPAGASSVSPKGEPASPQGKLLYPVALGVTASGSLLFPGNRSAFPCTWPGRPLWSALLRSGPGNLWRRRCLWRGSGGGPWCRSRR